MVLNQYIRKYVNEFNGLDRKNWNYEDGCVLIGEQAMYEATGDDIYLDSIRRFIDRYVNEDGSIKYYDREEYNLDRIPSGRVLFLLYRKTGLEKYRKAIENLMMQLREHPRTECGSFWHKKIYPYQIWLDGLYMGMPYYMLYENNFGDGNGYSDVIKQFQNARQYLYSEEKHIHYHAYDEKKRMFWADKNTGLSENFWSRAIGWHLMAMVDCYEMMPEEKTEYRDILQKLYNEALDGVLEYADPKSGMLYQLTALKDEPGNYLETSSSTMLAYSILKACRMNMIEKSYIKYAVQIMASLETVMMKCEEGELRLTGMCLGAGLGPEDNTRRDGSIYYYLNEPVVADEQKGAGVMMMAYSEWLKSEDVLKDTEYLGVHIYNKGY